MIEIKDLNKSYGKNHILRNIDLIIPDGKVTAIAGPNASGKTTLIKSILGLVKKDSGSIVVADTDIDKDPNYRCNIGYMPQIGRYPDNLSVEEIIRMIKELRGTVVSYEDHYIELFGLSEHLKKKMRTLSGGTTQKVSAVLALMFNPKILILDEPTTGLDPVSGSRLKTLIANEKKNGKTVVLISHIISEIQEMADNLVYLLDGKIIVNSGVDNILTKIGGDYLEQSVAKIISMNGKAVYAL